VPKKGNRIVRVTYAQEISINKKTSENVFKCPLKLRNSVKNFRLKIQVDHTIPYGSLEDASEICGVPHLEFQRDIEHMEFYRKPNNAKSFVGEIFQENVMIKGGFVCKIPLISMQSQVHTNRIHCNILICQGNHSKEYGK
jgi:hypothetical protein